MGILADGKKMLKEKQRAEQDRLDKKEAEFVQLRKDAVDRMQRFLEDHLSDVKGKKATDGRKILIDCAEDAMQITIRTCLSNIAVLFFGFTESLQHDSDGGAWGTGDYYPDDKMRLYWPHADGCVGYAQNLSRDQLAIYLAQCVK